MPPLQPLSCCTSVHKRLSTLSAGEQQIYDAVSEGFPDSSNVKVHDISGKPGHIVSSVHSNTNPGGVI